MNSIDAKNQINYLCTQPHLFMKQMDVTCTIRHNLCPVNVAEATPFFTHSNNVEIYVLYNTFVKWMLIGCCIATECMGEATMHPK